MNSHMSHSFSRSTRRPTPGACRPSAPDPSRTGLTTHIPNILGKRDVGCNYSISRRVRDSKNQRNVAEADRQQRLSLIDGPVLAAECYSSEQLGPHLCWPG